MDYTKVLKQAWQNAIGYRALWVFGLILALTTVSSTNVFMSDSARQQDEGYEGGFMGTGVTLEYHPGDDFGEALGNAVEEVGAEFQKGIDEADRELTGFYRNVLGKNTQFDFLRILTIILWWIVAFYLIGKVFRYVSETALIMMVDDQEKTGEQLRTRDGFRMGWSRTSWRLFLIDLLINVSATAVFIVLFALVFSPLLLLVLGIAEISVLSAVLTSGLFFLFIFLAIIAGQVLRVWKHFARRECALKELGPFASIRSGFRIVRNNLKDVGITWLVLVGVNIGWPVLLGISAIFLFAAAIVIGGVAGLLTGLTAGVFGASEPVLVGAVVAIPLFMLTLIIPLFFLGGLKEVFVSSTWTLTYRELKALTGLKAEVVPEPDAV